MKPTDRAVSIKSISFLNLSNTTSKLCQPILCPLVMSGEWEGEGARVSKARRWGDRADGGLSIWAPGMFRENHGWDGLGGQDTGDKIPRVSRNERDVLRDCKLCPGLNRAHLGLHMCPPRRHPIFTIHRPGGAILQHSTGAVWWARGHRRRAHPQVQGWMESSGRGSVALQVVWCQGRWVGTSLRFL